MMQDTGWALVVKDTHGHTSSDVTVDRVDEVIQILSGVLAIYVDKEAISGIPSLLKVRTRAKMDLTSFVLGYEPFLKCKYCWYYSKSKCSTSSSINSPSL